MSTHDHKDMLEVRADVFGGERERPWLLEHDGDDVVPNMTLPQQLENTKKLPFAIPDGILRINTSSNHDKIKPFYKTHLLLVVGCVGQHGRHVEHDFIILVIGIQGVSSC